MAHVNNLNEVFRGLFKSQPCFAIRRRRLTYLQTFPRVLGVFPVLSIHRGSLPIASKSVLFTLSKKRLTKAVLLFFVRVHKSRIQKSPSSREQKPISFQSDPGSTSPLAPPGAVCSSQPGTEEGFRLPSPTHGVCQQPGTVGQAEEASCGLHSASTLFQGAGADGGEAQGSVSQILHII